MSEAENVADDSHAQKVQQTQAQLEAIEQEIRKTQPLTSDLKDVTSLKKHYESDTAAKYFEMGVNYLSTLYAKTRMIRGDGNCYYRAFLYSLCESIKTNPAEMERIVKYVKESNQQVVNIGGYDEMTMELFYDCIVEFLDGLSKMSSNDIHKELNEENGTSDYATWYLRVLTATYLKADPQRFIPYLEDGYMDIAAFCQAQIEPMGKECTMVQVLALAEAFQVRVKIEYLDGREFQSTLTSHEFGPESSPTQLSLLYRPGHYDILYTK